MEIKKSELKKALEIVKPGLANKELIEQSTSFAFMGDRVVTYNDDISISHPIPGLELTGAVKAEKLYQLLEKLKEEDITIEVSESEIVLKSGRAKAGLTLQAEIKLPLEEEIAYAEKWKKLPGGFLAAVSMAKSSCSRDNSRPVLTCVHVRKDGAIEASDSLRIMKMQLPEKMPLENFLLPSSAATIMVGLKPTHIAKGNGWVHFKTKEETVLSCRIFADKFPETENWLAVKGTKVTFPKEINGVLERAGVFAKRDHLLDETVSITLDDKRVKIRGEAEDGWFEESARITYTGTPLTFYITPYLIKSILSVTQEGILSDGMLKFEKDDWEYVSMLKTKKNGN